MDLLVHMSVHTGVVHQCAPFLEHIRDHLSAVHLSADHLSENVLMWSALMCPCLKKKKPTPAWSSSQPHLVC